MPPEDHTTPIVDPGRRSTRAETRLIGIYEISKILARPADVLARTKRACNKHLIEHWNLAQDLASAYELTDFWSHAAAGEMD